ncbi:MAG: enoyl-CoA hydratase [Proteobacteria bacterium]|nr:MAG: enoyl-CoA hydratase [Pseudomonadota bacterium]
MNFERITVQIRERVLLLGLNRPEKRNAFDLQMYAELGLALARLDHDSSLRCGLLFAHGAHFTGGLELPQWLPFFRDGRMPPLADGACDPLGLDLDRTVHKPVVMAVQGWCLTIGIELMLAADIRIAAEDTRFAQIEVKRGIYPVGGATMRLAEEVGWGNAMRVLLTAEEFSAQDAFRIGLVQEVVPVGAHYQRALELAQVIARQSPVGVQATLASARLARRDGSRAAQARLMTNLQTAIASDDAVEGLNAFLERREPRFD